MNENQHPSENQQPFTPSSQQTDQPMYGQPGQPAYGQPGQPAYGQPGQPAYGQPAQPAYGQPGRTSNYTLNFWLSAFFGIIPAVIFWAIERDHPDRRAQQLNTQNLNYAIITAVVALAAGLLSFAFVGLLLYPVWFALFVIHIVAAINLPQTYANPQKQAFLFNINLVK